MNIFCPFITFIFCPSYFLPSSFPWNRQWKKTFLNGLDETYIVQNKHRSMIIEKRKKKLIAFDTFCIFFTISLLLLQTLKLVLQLNRFLFLILFSFLFMGYSQFLHFTVTVNYNVNAFLKQLKLIQPLFQIATVAWKIKIVWKMAPNMTRYSIDEIVRVYKRFVQRNRMKLSMHPTVWMSQLVNLCRYDKW